MSDHQEFIDSAYRCIECNQPMIARVDVEGQPVATMCGNGECELFMCELVVD